MKNWRKKISSFQQAMNVNSELEIRYLKFNLSSVINLDGGVALTAAKSIHFHLLDGLFVLKRDSSGFGWKRIFQNILEKEKETPRHASIQSTWKIIMGFPIKFPWKNLVNAAHRKVAQVNHLRPNKVRVPFVEFLIYIINTFPRPHRLSAYPVQQVIISHVTGKMWLHFVFNKMHLIKIHLIVIVST